MRLYISGPITNKDPEVQKDNLHRFDMAESVLSRAGYDTFNPANLGRLHPDWSSAEYMRADIEALLKCGGVVFLPGWRGSKGALLEMEIALACDIHVANGDRWLERASGTEAAWTL